MTLRRFQRSEHGVMSLQDLYQTNSLWLIYVFQQYFKTTKLEPLVQQTLTKTLTIWQLHEEVDVEVVVFKA